MSEFELFLRIILCMLLGFAIGIERDTKMPTMKNNIDNDKGRLGGIRTFTFISLLGGISGIVLRSEFSIIAYLTFGFILLLVCLSYILYFLQTKSLGITTEVATVITFLIGVAITSAFINIKIVLAIVILMVFLLSQKTGIHRWVSTINRVEIKELIKFAVLILAVYPFLPNYSYTLRDIPFLAEKLTLLNLDSQLMNIQLINPSTLWLIIVLISGLNLFGYLFSKVFGKGKAIFLTSFSSGFISSTSTITAYSVKSKNEKESNLVKLAAGGIVAHGSSHIPILLVIFSLNQALFQNAFLPLVATGITGLIIGIVMLIISGKEIQTEEEVKYKLFSLTPAVKFALLLLVIKIISQLSFIYLGTAGFYISSMIGSLAGLEAVTVSIAQIVDTELTLRVGTYTLLGAMAVNTLWKIFYAYTQGNDKFARLLALGIGISYLSGLVTLIFIS